MTRSRRHPERQRRISHLNHTEPRAQRRGLCHFDRREKSFRDPCKFIGIFLTFASQLLCFLPAVSAAAPAKFIIGYAAMSARVVPLWIAEEQGILAKYGVDSEQVFIRGAPTLVTGLTSGDIHFGSTGGTATLAAIAAGHDLKMVAAFSSRNTYDLVTRRPSNEPKSCAANDSASPASAARFGWASCFG